MVKKEKTVIIGVTASVACYKALDIIRGIKRPGVSIEVILTKETENFIRPILFQAISGARVIAADLFKLPEEWEAAHISLADRARLVLVVPATANIIGKIAAGICDDMLTCTVCATKAPVVFVPAMNEAMYRNKIVQENISKLKRAGYQFIGPVRGRLACGTHGLGHIQDTRVIVDKVVEIITRR